MQSESNANEGIVKYIASVLQAEYGSDHGWLRHVWVSLSEAPKMLVFPNTMGTSDFIETRNSYNDLHEFCYDDIARHIPCNKNLFIGKCIIKLREAIIAENPNSMELWTVKLQVENNEETNVLAYFLSVLYFLFTTEADDNNQRIRAFTLLTMLVRLWRKSLPSACIVPPVDIDEPLVSHSIYNGEATLPDGYQAIHTLFIFALNWFENSPAHVELLTNDVLYDISMIVRMPVTFTLGVHIAKLCSIIALQSEMAIGDEFESCDVRSSKIDIAFSWIYHLLLNTPPNLHDTVCDNVGAAFSIFVHLFEDDAEISPPQNKLNRQNVVKFFSKISCRIAYSNWTKKVFSTLGYRYGRYNEFSKMIFQLPLLIGWGIIKSMLCDNKDNAIQIAEVCGNYLVLLNSNPNNGDSQQDTEEIVHIKGQLIYLTLLPLADAKINKDVLQRYLQVIYNLVSQPERKFCEDMTNFKNSAPITRHVIRMPLNIIYMISNQMCLAWTDRTVNQLIISIWCKFVKLFDELELQHFKAIALLIENSNPYNLEPCLNDLKTIVPYFAIEEADEFVVVRIINIFFRHALDPGSMSQAYVRVLFNAIFDGIMIESRRPIAYRVARCVCNNNGSHILFQLFRELRLLTDEIVSSIVNIYITHDEPVAWNIMYYALQAVEYTEIPPYMLNMLRSFLQMQILCNGFEAETQLAFFGSMLSIVKYRRARHLIGQGDDEFFQILSTYIKKCFETSHSTSQVQFMYLDLIAELRRFMPDVNKWIPIHFQSYENAIAAYLNNDTYYVISATRLALFKEIAKSYGDMAIRLKLQANKPLVQLIATRLKAEMIRDLPTDIKMRYSIIWETLALMFGKICLVKMEYVTIYIHTMIYVLRNAIDRQPSMIIEALSDICRIHIENVDLIRPYLLEYLSHRSYLQVSACEAMLNLLKYGPARFNRTEFLMLINLIATERSTLRTEFMRLFEKNLLPNNTNIILTNFIPMMLYFNKVFNHPDYVFNADEKEKLCNIPGVVHDRSYTYTALLKYIKTSDKFQLMLKIAKDIIGALHSRHLSHSAQSLNMLTDAYKVIYIIIKTIDNKYDVPDSAVQMYANTFLEMESMEKQCVYLFMDYDSVIKDILEILLKVLEDIHTIHANMFQDTFHLIMFLIATFSANVHSLMVAHENTPFSGNVKVLSVLYDRRKELFTTYGADIYTN